MNPMVGTLYVVATPIGNLGDITLRAIETLRAVDIVAAEDTRRTRGLLTHLSISKPLVPAHSHSGDRELTAIIEAIEGGRTVALVTDAGTPAVSDPGGALVARAIAVGIPVIPIPGASAVLCALVASGLCTDAGFRFFGFISRDGVSRAEVLGHIAATCEPCVLYEAPNRVQSTLVELARAQPARQVAVARELTKVHEEFVRGTLSEVAAEDREWKGEVVLVLGETEANAESVVDEHMLNARIDAELAQGTHAKSAAERIAAWSGLPKRSIYERIIRRKQER